MKNKYIYTKPMKIMKNLIIFLFCLATTPSFAQTTTKFDGPAWKPPYKLTMEGWGIERFLIPIDFAPQIPYKGVEDIRFAHGWGDIKSKEYWSYAFLWCLDGVPAIKADSIAKHLNYYYDGLVSRNIEKRNIPTDMVIKTKTIMNPVKTNQGDLQTFEGTVFMLDYMGKQPMTLRCIVHLRKCAGSNKIILFHQLSPQPYTDPVWEKLKKLWADFECNQ
jgi:hypothetical protein